MSFISFSQNIDSLTTQAARNLNQSPTSNHINNHEKADADYSKLFAKEMVRSLNKSVEAFKEPNHQNGISSHFDELSSELLSDLIATRLSEHLFANPDLKHSPTSRS